MKKYLIEFQAGTSSHWTTCGHWNARTSAGALAQFTKLEAKHIPDMVAVRATEVKS